MNRCIKYAKAKITKILSTWSMKISNSGFSKSLFKKRFCCPQDMIGLLRSDLRIIAKVWCCMGLYWSARGCNLTAHSSIHAYLILRRGLTRFQLLLRPENNRVQEFFWYSGMRPGCHTDRKHHTFCSKSFVSPDGYPQVPIAGNHRLSLLVNLSSLHHHSLGSIHFKLLFVE